MLVLLLSGHAVRWLRVPLWSCVAGFAGLEQRAASQQHTAATAMCMGATGRCLACYALYAQLHPARRTAACRKVEQYDELLCSYECLQGQVALQLGDKPSKPTYWPLQLANRQQLAVLQARLEAGQVRLFAAVHHTLLLPRRAGGTTNASHADACHRGAAPYMADWIVCNTVCSGAMVCMASRAVQTEDRACQNIILSQVLSDRYRRNFTLAHCQAKRWCAQLCANNHIEPCTGKHTCVYTLLRGLSKSLLLLFELCRLASSACGNCCCKSCHSS